MSVFKIIYSDFINAKEWIKDWFFYRRTIKSIETAIRIADEKQITENLQNYVLVYRDPIRGIILESVNKLQIEKLKQKKILPKHISMVELKKSFIFYSTSSDTENKTSKEDREIAKWKYIKYAKKNLRP